MKQAVYKIMDFFTGGRGIKRRISGFEVRIPTRYYKYFEPDYEEENIKVIDRLVTTGMNVIDVGSHIGLLAMILAKKTGPSGKVIAFEPTPSTYNLLQQTIRINNTTDFVIPVNKAVADKAGMATFYVSEIEANNSNSLSENKTGTDGKKKIEIPLVSIDEVAMSYNLRSVDFIKIDAEGAEYSVLKGATSVIDKFHPNILLGLHPAFIKNFGDSLSLIWDYVTNKGYDVIYRNEKMDKEHFIKQENLFDVFLITRSN